MIPNWLIQTAWFAAGVFATGAFWYFMSKQNYLLAVWTGFAALVLALTAVAFHLHNDLKRQPATPDGPQGKAVVDSSRDSPPSTSAAAPGLADQHEAAIASADDTYSSMTMEEWFDNWYHKATTSLQRDELEASMLNRRVIWNSTIQSIESRTDDISITVDPIDESYGTAFLSFDKSQRSQLVQLHKGQQIRFTGRIRSFLASPFLYECRILKILN